MYYTLKELPNIVDIDIYALKVFINSNPHKDLFFHKVGVPVEVYNPKCDRTYKYSRTMYVIEEEKIEAFKYFWEHKRKKQNRTNGLDGAKRLTWTDQAIDCYNAKCICKNCNHSWICSRLEKHTKKRFMKDAVLKLFANFGAPPERIDE